MTTKLLLAVARLTGDVQYLRNVVESCNASEHDIVGYFPCTINALVESLNDVLYELDQDNLRVKLAPVKPDADIVESVDLNIGGSVESVDLNIG